MEIKYIIQVKYPLTGWNPYGGHMINEKTANEIYEIRVQENPQVEFRLIKVTTEVIRKV